MVFQKHCRIWNYHWRLWTIPEATELLLAAGFDAVHTWLRPLRQTGTTKVPLPTLQISAHTELARNKWHQSQSCWMQGADEEDDDDEEEEFVECGSGHTLPPGTLQRINQRGWTAYLVAVVQPKETGH